MEVPDIVRAYVDAFCRGDLEAVRDTFEPEGTYEDPGTKEPVLGDRIDKHFAEAFGGMPDITTETTGLDAISDQVSVWRWTIRATQTNTYRGLPPTGRSIAFPGCEFIEVHNDKIHKIVGFYDRLTMLTQLGFTITPPAPVSV
jgi:steroid delta-isomerase-like uncharacterized protein